MLINNINFKYGSNEIYNNFNIEFQQGKINCIIGESKNSICFSRR